MKQHRTRSRRRKGERGEREREVLTERPSTVCFSIRTRSTTDVSANSTNPKPLALPVALSFMITASTTSPKAPKYSFSLTSLVSHGIPPTNTLLWSGFIEEEEEYGRRSRTRERGTHSEREAKKTQQRRRKP